MKKHKIILAGACAFIGASILTYSHFEEKKEIEHINLPPTNDQSVKEDKKKPTVETVSEEKDINIFLLGEQVFKNNEHTTYLPLSWNDHPNKQSRFILIDSTEPRTEEKTTIIQDWIQNKKVILFYGSDVSAEEVKNKIGMEMETIEIMSNGKLPYLLFGFGYSEYHKQNIPIFLSSNSHNNLEVKISNFLSNQHDF